MGLVASDVEYALNSEFDKNYGYWDEIEWYFRDTNTIEVNGESHPFKVVTLKTGVEGDWETNTYIVVKVGDQYFRKTGYYQSHVGNDWDGPLTEVVAAEKRVTVWEDK